MNLLQEYKCPCCGGAIEFDSTAQKMKCPYCRTEFDMETLQGYDDALKTEQPDDMQWETAAGGEWQQGEIENLRSYVCKSCGGADIPARSSSVSGAATASGFCGNSICSPACARPRLPTRGHSGDSPLPCGRADHTNHTVKSAGKMWKKAKE